MSNRPISVVEFERRRLATAASLSKDLEAITALGLKNMVEFNASKTQYCTLSNKRCPSEHSVLMNNQALPSTAGNKLGYLFRTRKYFSPSNLLTLYKAQIRPSLEYCSHIWGAAAPTTLSILDAVQRRAIRLIGDPALTCHLQPLSHRRAVGMDQLSDEQKEQLYEVIELYKDIAPSDSIGCTHLYTHHVDTGNAKPIRQRQYPLPYMMEKALHKEIDEMLAMGIIEPCQSAWNSPLWLVGKKDGSYRVCFDGGSKSLPIDRIWTFKTVINQPLIPS
nr:unnamed protein product [Callosobruchus chinensis]